VDSLSGPTCRRLQATHINMLSNLINSAEVCRHLFIMLQNPAGFRGRKIILLQAPAEGAPLGSDRSLGTFLATDSFLFPTFLF
jgi:hypothetical protein